MYRKTSLLLVALMTVFCTSAQNIVTYDQLSFTEPANWTFADNGTYHTYLNLNRTANIFCIISIYNSTVSSGNSNDDFTNAWNNIVAGHFTVLKEQGPKKITSQGGMDYLEGESVVSNNQGNLFAQLLVFVLPGKTQSILFLSQNQNGLAQYKPDLDNFLASLKSTSAVNTNSVKTSPATNASSAGSTNSGLIHFNHFLFTVPEGWKAAQDGTVLTMTAPVQTPDEMLTFILLPPVTDTGFQDAGNNAINQVATSMGGEAIPNVSGSRPLYFMLTDGKFGKGWDYSMGTGSIRVVQKTNDPYTSYLFFTVGVFLAKINSRMERVLYLSKDFKCGIYQTTTAYKGTFDPIVTNFFFNLKFDDWKEANINSGKLTHSGISYLWSGVSYMNGAWEYDKGYQTGKYQASFFILFDNGQAYYQSHFPRHGLLNLNTLSEAANNPANWGTYTYQNGSGTIKISSWLTIPFTLKDGKLMAQMNGSVRPFAKLPSIDDAILNGTWCFEGSCISFTSDGKFSDNGVIQKLEHLPTTCNYNEPENGQGTYEIKNNSITFRYTGGLTIQSAISGLNIENGNLSTGQLALGWYNDVLQKK